MNTKFYKLSATHMHPKCAEDRITGKCNDRAYYKVIRKGIKVGLNVCKEHLRVNDKVDIEYDYLSEFNENTSYFD